MKVTIKKNTQASPITTVHPKGVGHHQKLSLLSRQQGDTECIGLKNALESCSIACQCVGFWYILRMAFGSMRAQVFIDK